MSARNRWWRDYLDECREWWNEFLCAPETAPRHAYAVLEAMLQQLGLELDPDAPLCEIMPPGWLWLHCPSPFCTQRAGHLGACA